MLHVKLNKIENFEEKKIIKKIIFEKNAISSSLLVYSKDVMQGKLIVKCILCVHIETSSLRAEFVNKNRCISVRLVSEEVKSIKF